MAENVREIVAEWLKANGFDGLYGYDCGCTVDDLMPCSSEGLERCEAGYKTKCDPEHCAADGDCDFHIGPAPEKPEKESGK